MYKPETIYHHPMKIATTEDSDICLKFVDNCLNLIPMTPLSQPIQRKLSLEITRLLKGSVSKVSPAVPLGRSINFDELMGDKLMMMRVIREGVPYTLFTLIQMLTPFSEDEWATLLQLSAKSLQRYKQASKRFKPLQSEKIIEMAEVAKVGLEVFGSMEKFRLWLSTPNYALGNLPPRELLHDSYGKELVVDELTRINYGILV